MAGTVLVVEDDADIGEIVALYLRKEGFSVELAPDAGTALASFARSAPDLVLTDILLPDTEGTELVRRIRERSDVPVIFMSCKREAQDVIDGLELGGDDYITKPFEPSVVVARVKAHIRRARGRTADVKPPEPVWKDRRLKIDPVSCDVRVRGEPVTLFAKERQLLLFLAERPNQVFSVEQLYEQVWGWDKQSDMRTVFVHIRTLRKKIEPDPASPRYIQTVRGFGYKFCWAEPTDGGAATSGA
ncbi:response regulator transcription factor [Paenibacillus flagellatus]|uniref:DNA-binding response regulator n=1 Tax=Paenibacillus flagellatus TaxID=2211139 RepID=A0A2V5K096_9BACL|nr:response regulator transcription factor [Paenibacillus flagellatus]PYI51054.1 DNA-binding response regulator [Paenibacillus flagellatus]